MKPTEILEKLKKIDKDQLIKIKGIGSKTIESLDNFLNSPRYQYLLNGFARLEAKNSAPDITISRLQTTPSQGVVCITGTFEQPRTILRGKLTEMGYEVVDTITKKTTILLAGKDPGSKIEKAKKLGIRIIQSLQDL